MILLDGKKIANDIKEEIAIEVNKLKSSGGKIGSSIHKRLFFSKNLFKFNVSLNVQEQLASFIRIILLPKNFLATSIYLVSISCSLIALKP